MIRVLDWGIIVFLKSGCIVVVRCSRPQLETFKQSFADCPRNVREAPERVCPFKQEKSDMLGGSHRVSKAVSAMLGFVFVKLSHRRTPQH